MSTGEIEKSEMTDAQKARMERNRQHALLLRQARLANHPYKDANVSHVAGTKLLDTGAGFLVEEPIAGLSKDNNAKSSRSNKCPTRVCVVEPPVFPEDMHMCEECGKPFGLSTLWTQFEASVCDNCKDEEDKHCCITKTDAKAEFLLKDVDLDQREPLLKFIVRKNPHNPRWGDMKLYLKCQIYERAMDVWGSEEELEEARLEREDNREKKKINKFNKKMKSLRMAVRSSTYTKDLSGHAHVYGPETYNEGDDTYSKTCETCGQSVNYEKM